MTDTIMLIIAVVSVVLNAVLIFSQRRKYISGEALDQAKVSELVQAQYDKLIQNKDLRIDGLEGKMEKLEARYRNDLALYKKYINYLLKGITEDKHGTFAPIDLVAFELAQAA